jgi:hypothetical protein
LLTTAAQNQVREKVRVIGRLDDAATPERGERASAGHVDEAMTRDARHTLYPAAERRRSLTKDARAKRAELTALQDHA